VILRRGSTLLVVLGVVAALLVGGCGGSDDTTSAAPLASSVAPGLQTTGDDEPSRFCDQLTHLDEGIKLPPGLPTLGTKGSYLRQDHLVGHRDPVYLPAALLGVPLLLAHAHLLAS
jgi:hypothetical protein